MSLDVLLSKTLFAPIFFGFYHNNNIKRMSRQIIRNNNQKNYYSKIIYKSPLLYKINK